MYTVSKTKDIVKDSKTNLEWQRYIPNQTFTLREAKEFAANLSLDGGQWRVPTIEELISLVNPKYKEPTVNTKIFPTPNQLFWSSTSIPHATLFAYCLNFRIGKIYVGSRVYSHHLRCVRNIKIPK